MCGVYAAAGNARIQQNNSKHAQPSRKSQKRCLWTPPSSQRCPSLRGEPHEAGPTGAAVQLVAAVTTAGRGFQELTLMRSHSTRARAPHELCANSCWLLFVAT